MTKEIKLVSDTIDRTDIQRLSDWLLSVPTPRLTKGQVTLDFERKWSTNVGVKNTTFVNSGSSAILLALAALKEKGMKNLKVVAPAVSWLTDVSSIMQLGLTPILCDCNLQDLSIDLKSLESIFAEEKPAALILVSVLGLVPDMERVISLCQKYDVILIEDVCESMGSKFRRNNLGNFGIATVFSLYFGHHLSTIEGGLICTNDDQLHELIISMRSHGWDRDWPQHVQEKYRKEFGISEFDALYTFYYPGFNVRSTDLQAFIGLSQLEKLEKFSMRRSQNFLTYKDLLKYNRLPLETRSQDFISNFAYPYVSDKRSLIVGELKRSGVEVRPLIAGSMARKPFWIKAYGRQAFKNADALNDSGFYLPNHQDLSEEDIKFICDIINTVEEKSD